MFTGFDISTIQDAKLGSTQIQAIYLGSQLLWPTTPHDYSQDYFTIKSLADNNTIGWSGSESLLKTISVSSDNGTTWISKTSSTSGTTLANLNTGDKLLIKGSNITYGDSHEYNSFSSTGNFNVEGNIMSLIYEDNFIGKTTLSGHMNFYYMFISTKVVSAENLILPATTLADSCYESMFQNCTSLTTPPRLLPATILRNSCYSSMFAGCTALITAPELPATTLNFGCYRDMFQHCSSLTTAPALPATTLTEACYFGMFDGCSSLTTAPALPATTLVNNCYNGMFWGCRALNYIKCLATDITATWCTVGWVYLVSATGTFVKNASMSSWTTGTDGIPSGWTIQNT